MSCASCTDRPTCREPCERLRAVLPTTCNALSEKLSPTSELPHLPKLTLPEMEGDLSESTRLPKFPGFSERDMAILAGRYIDKLSHQELSERFGFSERSSWVILHRLKVRAVKVSTVSENC